MNLHDLFNKTDAYWVHYSEYEYRDLDSKVFVVPTEASKVSIYDPLKVSDALVVDALNVGMLCMRENPDERKIRAAILDFSAKYGLLGFMTALPTTAEFVDYDAVYLPKNPIIKAETMDVNEYVALFFPFDKPQFRKSSKSAQLDVAGDREEIARALTFGHSPMAMRLCCGRGYGERYDWLRKQFKDWAYSLCGSVFFYEEDDEVIRDLHRQAMSAFGGIAPHYRIALYDDAPTLVWDFHSLLQTIQIVISFAVTDKQHPLRLCKHCTKAFLAKDSRSLYCSKECKNAYNTNKKRGLQDAE